ASPSMASFRRDFLKKFPKARWIAWEPVNDENIYEGARLATGRDLQPINHYDKARVILALDSDFLHSESEAVAASLGFADGRRVKTPQDDMNRLYVVEPLMTLTGGMADHRLRLRSREVGSFALALAVELKKQGLKIDSIDGVTAPTTPGDSEKWLTPLAKDLLRARGESLVTAGRRQPAAVHALVTAINEALGNLGKTIDMVDTPDTLRSNTASLRELVDGMKSGQVEYLFVMGGNPAYDAPVDFEFAAALKKVPHTVRVGMHQDETGQDVEWNINRAHFLESWGDALAVDGSPSVIQPMIEPLYGGKADVEIAGLLATGRDMRGYDIVRDTWGKIINGNFEERWKKVLHDGVLADSSLEPSKPKIDSDAVARTLTGLDLKSDSDLEIIFHPCNKVYDGRQANNGWMQELPDPITKLSWDNVATMSVATARELGLKNGQMVRLQLDKREVTMPAWIVPGQAHKTVGVAFGYGRTKAGRVGNKVGVDSYVLRTSAMLSAGFGLQVLPTGETYELADAQHHGSMEGRPIIREATLDEYREDPEFAKEMVEHPPLRSSWTEPDYSKGYQWGMSIDLTTCTGCNACAIACQAENNIPIVGKTQVGKGREMHWIRVDRYYEGDVDQPSMLHQAMPCQHCENAPCEQVCPVAATTHDSEGLNVMVYNRCIGTRYCSNNCPYKVRRFNFFSYTDNFPDTIKMAQNPDVTVRSRGVMEKCSYCVQRINRGKKAAKLENRTVRDGEIVSACQQACPADAIVFGDINDPDSR
ncbi:MAG: 4Fe-4S dicluster domain-containing protein, partial [Alphaproteobacteria bacterium]|nr:4Fe-4S dicluster domain-containing protein [Alphaproteobacteria bacterium]